MHKEDQDPDPRQMKMAMLDLSDRRGSGRKRRDAIPFLVSSNLNSTISKTVPGTDEGLSGGIR